MSLRQCVLSHSLFTKTRLYSLYSDFRKLKEANPDGYEANLIAWKSLVEEFFQKNLLSHFFVLDTNGLVEELILPEYGKPLALDLVLDELIKSGDLILLKQFKAESLYTKKWVRPVLSWAVNKFIMDTNYKVGDRNSNLKKDQFISKKALETYTFELLQAVSLEKNTTNLLFPLDHFKKFVDSLNVRIYGKKPTLTDLDYEVLLTYLSRDVSKLQFDGEIVKFGQDEITEQDKSIIQLKSTIEASHLKSNELSEKIGLLDSKIKMSLKNKNRDLAKLLLRSKKIAEDSLTKQIVAINQLESVLYKIDEASSNIQLLQALDASSALLENLNAEIGGVERVEDIMNKLVDEKTKTDKITEEIVRVGSEDIDEDEIDKEYEEILRQESEKSKLDTDRVEQDVNAVSDKLSKLKLPPSQIKSEPQLKSQPLHN